jgi:L-ascorbate metabolism protein UlaG (beta-lactamase superfamily)
MNKETLDKALRETRFFAQGSLKIEHGGKVVYTDPFQVDKAYNDADIVFITHPHFDHYSAEDIAKAARPGTVFYACEEAAASLLESGIAATDVHEVAAGDAFNLGFARFTAVPAYNIVKAANHPKASGWFGCLLDYGDIRIYYTSDTELIDEMGEVACDIVFLPLGQTYTFNSVDEAAIAALRVGAAVAVPVHYGLYEGTDEDVVKLRDLLAGKIEVVVL